MSKTKLVSAFPGCGKSYTYNHIKKESPHLKISDSDSSNFDKSDFPNNYIKHIKEKIAEGYDIIFISSHEEVRNALVENDLKFTLVYPDKSIKNEYIQRYINRGNTSVFVKLLDNNWDSWISQLDMQENCDKIVLQDGEYLMDVIKL